MKVFVFATLIILLLSVSGSAQSNADACRVTASTWIITDGRGTGIDELGTFTVTVSDDRTIKSFKFEDYDAALIVTVGVEYGDAPAVEKGQPTQIKLVMAVSQKKQDPFDFIEFPNSVAAETTYGHLWGSLSITKQVGMGKLIHAFTLACNDGSKSKKR
jgi:hypothetical protein